MTSNASMHHASHSVIVASLVTLAACARERSTPRNGEAALSHAFTSAASPAPLPSDAAQGVRFVDAPSDGDAAEWIRRARDEAGAHRRRVIVYVGADWCPPCQTFHLAIEAHLLDRSLPELTLLEFDHDLDGDRLRRAGYTCRSLPCFTAPGADGRATSGHAEGVESVDAIARHLRRLLDTHS